MDEVSTYFGGQIKITVVPREMRMSHWVYAPKIEEVTTNNVLLDLTGDLWDLVGAKEEKEVLTLALRKYPGGAEGVSISVRKGESLLYLKGKAYEGAGLKKELDSYR